MLPKLEEKLRTNSSQHLHLMEAALYIAVGLLLSLAAIAAVVSAGDILWRGIVTRTLANYAMLVLDQLLLVLMLIEVLHTVRISLRSQSLLMEPFLIVGMIASIRRVLVITMQAAKMTEQGQAPMAQASTFQNTMLELGVLGLLIFVIAFAIYLLRRTSPREELVQ
jgi:uncharacterized membrane protein (DUF373 family)